MLPEYRDEAHTHKHASSLDHPPIHRPALKAGRGQVVRGGDLVARRRQRAARCGLAASSLAEARLAAYGLA